MEYTGSDSHVEIPPEIDGMPVLALGREMFYKNGLGIESIHVPSSVISIEDRAMSFCISLHEFVMEEGVEYLGDDIFEATQLKSFKLPMSVKRIANPGRYTVDIQVPEGHPCYRDDGEGLYYKKCLTRLRGKSKEYAVLPDTLSIDGYCMAESADQLQHLTIPAGIKRIDDGAFAGRQQLKIEIKAYDTVEKDNVPSETDGSKKEPSLQDVSYSVVDGTLLEYATGTVTILHAGPDGEKVLKDLILGSKKLAIRIGKMSFKNLKMKDIYLSENISAVEQDAFDGVEAERVIINYMGKDHIFRLPTYQSYYNTRAVASIGKDGELFNIEEYLDVIFDGALTLEKVSLLTYALSLLTEVRSSFTSASDFDIVYLSRNGTTSPDGYITGQFEIPLAGSSNRRKELGYFQKKIEVIGNSCSDFLKKQLFNIMELAIEERNSAVVACLDKAGIFSGENIGEVMDMANASNFRELVAALLPIKNRYKSSETAFDFSL